ncbi:MAG TPA: DUF5666 domain-containing protein, partial [Candidatus Limnocylindrales bacterium]|nr:DUF5666 domain-containing protein [Candidatus Limnocylindrales bacterium]
DVAITVQENARILRVEPGQTDLKSAAPMALTDIQPGDRLLARGHQGESTGTLTAAAIIVMKSGDVAEKQQKEMQDWQRRGAGGIVSALDASAGTVTVSVTPTMSVVVRTGRNTKFLRYAAGSIKFADAQPGTFDQIKVGDQLRARGAHSADGKELAAEEVISGTFRNIAGTISGIDAGASTVTVKDILGKKTVTVKLTADSQMRKLPPQLAQRIAFFLKSPEAAQAGMGRRMNAGGPGARPGGGGGDFQQIINRLPAVTLGDLQKEEAVMIVSTPGTGGREVTAITLLSGVEPILTSNASGAAALLNGWNLSAPSGDGGPQ